MRTLSWGGETVVGSELKRVLDLASCMQGRYDINHYHYYY